MEMARSMEIIEFLIALQLSDMTIARRLTVEYGIQPSGAHQNKFSP